MTLHNDFKTWFTEYFSFSQGSDSPYDYLDVEAAYKAGWKKGKAPKVKVQENLCPGTICGFVWDKPIPRKKERVKVTRKESKERRVSAEHIEAQHEREL
jgi:hypothetical protein